MNNFQFRQERQGGLAQRNKQICKDLLYRSPLSMGMIIILYIMFFICFFTDLSKGNFSLQSFDIYTLIDYGANYSQYVMIQRQYYRLITAMLLHAGILHIVMNSLSFIMFLSPVQKNIQNHLLFVCVLFFGGIMGNMLSDCVNFYLTHQIIIGVGASTSICAVIGLDFAFKYYRVNNRQTNSSYFITIIIYLFIISMLPRVDFFGHFGSLFGGLFIGLSFLEAGHSFGGREKIKSFQCYGRVLLGLYAGILTLGVLMAKQKK